MDENLSRGYIQFGKGRVMNELKYNNGLTHLSPPVDKFKFVHFSLVLAGMGFLLPYNSFIIPADYFQTRYPGTTIIFDMSVVYITVALFAVLINNMLVETLPLNTRITFGYSVSFFTLNFVVLCEVWWELFGVATSYTITLIAVAIVSLGCTVQQSSFYGYTSMLPSRYTQAVMTGESAAGFWVSMSRIVTKSMVEDERENTSIFFFTSIFLISLCAVLYSMLRRSEFVQFYINLCQERNRITLEPTEDVGLMDPLEQMASEPTKGQYGVLKLQTSPMGDSTGTNIELTTSSGTYSAFSFSNPVYEPGATSNTGNSGPTYKVEDVVTIRGSYGASQSPKPWSGIKKGLIARWEITKLIFPYMISIAFAYAVTLTLYPGIVSEVVSCNFQSWMPVILMATFNAADLVGKMLALIPYEWTRTQLLCFSSARAILVPLFLLCATPRRSTPILPGEGFPIFFSLVLGLTNGIVGSVPMIQAPTKVPEEHRELTGNIMTLSYVSGLFVGSLLAYMFDACLGPAIPVKQVCDTGHELRKAISMTSNRTLSIVASAATTIATPEIITRIPITKSTTAIATILTTTLLSNNSFEFAKHLKTTTLPNFLINATTHLSNTIVHH